jgi:branched-chain amino acid transport system ATP-binding protein
MSVLLAVEALAVGYGGVPALRGIDLTVGVNEAVALLGANGAGKSTLLKSIIGLLRPSAGRIRFGDRPIEALRADRRARLGIGYCPEGRRVFPGLTVRENLAVACWGSARLRTERTEAMFALFPALAERQGTLAWQLSGGQQQMLAIGRSLMDAPRLVLLDEPSLGLSPRLTDAVLSRVPAIVAGGTSVLLAEQNAAKALSVCARAVVLKLGVVAEAGPAAALAASDAVRAAFLGGDAAVIPAGGGGNVAV